MYELQKKIHAIVFCARISYFLKVLNCIFVHTIDILEIPIILSMMESIISLIGVMIFCFYKRKEINPNRYIESHLLINTITSVSIFIILLKEGLNPFSYAIKTLILIFTIAEALPFCISNLDIKYENRSRVYPQPVMEVDIETQLIYLQQ